MRTGLDIPKISLGLDKQLFTIHTNLLLIPFFKQDRDSLRPARLISLQTSVCVPTPEAINNIISGVMWYHMIGKTRATAFIWQL